VKVRKKKKCFQQKGKTLRNANLSIRGEKDLWNFLLMGAETEIDKTEAKILLFLRGSKNEKQRNNGGVEQHRAWPWFTQGKKTFSKSKGGPWSGALQGPANTAAELGVGNN